MRMVFFGSAFSFSPTFLQRSILRGGLFVGLLVGTTPWSASWSPLAGQQSSRETSFPVLLGSFEEDSIRSRQLIGAEPATGFLLRSPSGLSPWRPTADSRIRWQPVSPRVVTGWNSAIPLSLNEGALWGGRGANFQLTTGLQASYRNARLIFLPQISVAENRDFVGRRYPEYPLVEPVPGRSVYASPWYTDAYSIDMPLRFGSGAYSVFDLGQSSVTVHAGRFGVGGSTENQWWGPGIRNGIVMSNNAPGIPHLFLRTLSPLDVGWGSLEARWVVGGLTESPFFDADRTNDHRSLSGMVLAFSPTWEPNLTVGLARTNYTTVSSPWSVPLHLFDVLTNWETRDAVRNEWAPENEQILALFGRWLLPRSGIGVYGEWARNELPLSIRDFLLNPNHSQGYTLGAQWLSSSAPRLRVQAEVTNLEESSSFRHRPVNTYYLGRTVEQGYTHRGKVIGAAIGPGSSSQWLAFDLLAEDWQAGIFASRIRWETGALYSTRAQNPEREFRSFHSHDVSILAGVRGSGRAVGLRFTPELTIEKRYNYLFQNPDRGFGSEGAVDVLNFVFRLSASPG